MMATVSPEIEPNCIPTACSITQGNGACLLNNLNAHTHTHTLNSQLSISRSKRRQLCLPIRLELYLPHSCRQQKPWITTSVMLFRSYLYRLTQHTRHKLSALILYSAIVCELLGNFSTALAQECKARA